jgi:hypothetical protein
MVRTMATEPNPSMTALEGGMLQPGAAVILYDHRTGAIFSTHYFSAVNDAELPDKGELERVAQEQAAKDGCKLSTHKALHVSPAELKRGVGYRVAKGRLTEIRARRLKPLSATRSPKSR